MSKSQFYLDLDAARGAEQIALQQLQLTYPQYQFEDVSNVSNCYYRGDIRITNAQGAHRYIEVKADSRIHETGNILCEYGVYYKNDGTFREGNFKNSTDFYCVVSQAIRTIYIFDFDVLARIYKRGQHKVIHHNDQDTYCYLLPISCAIAEGALINQINY